ncbi:hypothetical protein [Hydrotalea sp.]|uniref:hypothetical protein n=1 Tax=Hydrotalea sp. TaxID=2881279 RepID=UPI0026254EF0|nr:hypothetical protein [Hydrotalea sp.]
MMQTSAPHSFHIPVMGLAYTIDSPIKVARFGIASTISIVEDNLIEMMRRYYYNAIRENYIPIPATANDYRAKRITDYLNLVNTIVQQQIEKLRAAAFETGSEIVKYFELLPENNTWKQVYKLLMQTNDAIEKANIEEQLRQQIVAGSIDVNIMTKADKNNYDHSGALLEDGSDAVAALRGYANSNLRESTIVFSAGMNPRVYNYLEKCPQFAADEQGNFKKKIAIKVSDYRSAFIQGKYLAKKGIWVSEFRIESGLNCGGHAFATDGYLMGPILETFKTKKTELTNTLFELYYKSNLAKERLIPNQPPPIKITVQGGIGTAAETNFLQQYYAIESIGWGTPFLLVPEATTVDEATLQLLCAAQKEDVILSKNSPLGVRFHYLRGTTADKEKITRIKNGKPGSPCTEKHLAFNTEFTEEPVCTASVKYQRFKIAQLQSLQLPHHEYEHRLKEVLDKECLCVGLSNAAAAVYNLSFVKNYEAVNICPGPNIAHFSKIVSLQTMVDHIYGRTNIITHPNRPHVFIAELHLYITYLQEQLEEDVLLNSTNRTKYFTGYVNNLQEGIAYYLNLADNGFIQDTNFKSDLLSAQDRLKAIVNNKVMEY